MVLDWPNENIQRGVFIRPSTDAAWIADDLQLLAADHPLFYALRGLDSGVETASHKLVEDGRLTRSVLNDQAMEIDALVADPWSISALSTRRRAGPTFALLGQAIIRGGRGVLDEESVVRAVDTTENGFAGAAEVDAKRTGAATNLLQRLLDVQQAGRMTRLLQSVWEGHGGVASQFPARDLVGGPLTDDDLIFLLRDLSRPGAEFWGRVARNVSAEQLTRLPLDDPSENLQLLMEALVNLIEVKALRISDEPLQLGEAENTPRWLLSRGCIVLRGDGWKAYAAPTRQEQLPTAEEWPGLGVKETRDRAQRLGIRVTDVQLLGAQSSITWEAVGNVNVINEKALSSLAEATSATVGKATLALRGGGRVVCDLTTRTAAGQTSAKFILGELLRETLPLLRTLAPEESDLVGQVLATAQGSLF
jgi:hypothetical protein